jgi:ABC-type uncharacterized transport system ATPase subunit
VQRGEIFGFLGANGAGKTYKRQNKMFRFYKTFCSEFSIVNTKQNVHFATKKIEATYSVAFKL